MPLQRACDAENQARNNLSNGPLRAQSKVYFLRLVFCDVLAYVSCREYVSILLSAQVLLWIKVAPRIVSYWKVSIRPWQIVYFCQGRFLFSRKQKKRPARMLTQKYVAQMQSFYDRRMCFTHSLFLRSIQSGNRLSLYFRRKLLWNSTM